MYIVRGR